MTAHRRAVVLGGGFTAMLTSAMLARHIDEVVVVERDEYPAGAQPRKGVPQARHCHILWSGGARIAETYLPGMTGKLLEAGAHRIGIPGGLVSLTPFGWQHRFPSTEFTLASSRALLDRVMREETLRQGRISVLERTEVLGLTGGADRITGVTIRDRDSGDERVLEAGLVVDATGRGSGMRRWLERIGVPAPQEESVDTGMVYATRVFRAPEGTESGFPLVSVLADARRPVPGRGAVLMPIEDGRWIVTLSGTRGGEPTADAEEFSAFARDGVRHPLIGDLIEGLEPLTAVQRSHSTVSRRLHYDRLGVWPEGLVVIGDATTAFNPVYGHGMSAAARSVVALEAQLRDRGLAAGLGRAAQRAVARAADDAWAMATSNDVGYPGCRVQGTDPRLTGPAADRRDADMVGALATRNRDDARAALALMTLSATVTEIQSPRLFAALRRGPEVPVLTAPPLLPHESARLRIPAAA
ncbi:FAD-dependent monooxygenase [Streptomyces chilikensis]|uniref:FAD-dependent monooxygenase n=1 Tax=Streptomyces chilikensis TaxID=1194079 RepID=UPI00140B21EA|nr:FAD-dependent monooxygenase [Streptomyces chilikensis]